VPADPAAIEGMSTFPIGALCVPNRGMVVGEDGQVVVTGAPGELLITGPNVMRGYWNLPENNARDTEQSQQSQSYNMVPRHDVLW
jgi:non-ribosomal peptide synthetase component E (peptide arylation enzyme)